MPTFTWVPDQGVKKSRKANVNKVRFGDGYRQMSADNINSIDDTWPVNFTLRTRTEIDAIDAFLESAKGVTVFDWVTPSGVSQNFTCDTWEASYNHDGDCSLSATFERFLG